MNIIIGQVSHETNTFAKTKTTKETFELFEWSTGDNLIKNHKGVLDYLGGMIDECEEQNIQIIPAFSAFAYPSGIITEETYLEIQRQLIDSIKYVKDVDAICLSMHGAGVAENVEDLEGSLLRALREEIGYDIPIIITLDLHGNITNQMVTETNLIVGVNYYPHIDSYDRGKEAIQLTAKLVKGEISPVMHLVNLPLIIPTTTTNNSPAKDINEKCWEYESESKVIDCTFYHGFPYTDISQIGVSVLVTTDGDAEKAKLIAESISNDIWEKRELFKPKILTPEEGIMKATSRDEMPVVINETSDNPGGGTPGDGTHLLRAMLNANVEKSCFGFIYDPLVVESAYSSGVGTMINVSLGGKTDDLHGKPVVINAYVKSLTDGKFIQSSPMWRGLNVNLGKSVRLTVGHVDIIVCSVKTQVLDEQVFILHGIDISNYKIVGLKSSQHFRAAFEPISGAIITVDSPGLTTLDFTKFNFQSVKRPIFPLDEVVEF